MPFQNWWTPIDGPISQVIPLIELTWIWCRPWCKTSRKWWESRRLPRAGMSVCASQCLVGLPPPSGWHSTQASRSGSHIIMHRYETHNSLDIGKETRQWQLYSPATWTFTGRERVSWREFLSLWYWPHVKNSLWKTIEIWVWTIVMAPWSPPNYDVKIIGGRKVIEKHWQYLIT